MKFACSMEFSTMDDRMVWPPSLSRDRKWPRVTKCTHSRVAGLRLEDNLVKATPTIVGEAFIFYLWTFSLQRTDIAARRRSGAPSKVYQWLGPSCRQKVTRKNFANRPPNFYRGSKRAKFGLDSQNQSPLTGSSFETEQHIGNLKHVSGA